MKNRECTYDGEEGQSLQEAKKIRNEALEKLMSTLQSASEGDAERLFQKIRSGKNIVALASSELFDTDEASVTASTDTPRTARSPAASTGAASAGHAPSTAGMLSTPSTATPEPDIKTMLSVTVTQSQPEILSYSIRITIPDASLTRASIKSFFSSAGKLFHVFTEAQLHCYSKSVFGSGGRLDASQRVAICSLAIVAAIGVQYNPGDFPKGLDELFYDVARHYYFGVDEERHPDKVKICTMMAMYNVMNKATAALAFLGKYPPRVPFETPNLSLTLREEAGLAMFRGHTLHGTFCSTSPVALHRSEDYRRTWRTLMFFFRQVDFLGGRRYTNRCLTCCKAGYHRRLDTSLGMTTRFSENSSLYGSCPGSSLELTQLTTSLFKQVAMAEVDHRSDIGEGVHFTSVILGHF